MGNALGSFDYLGPSENLWKSSKNLGRPQVRMKILEGLRIRWKPGKDLKPQLHAGETFKTQWEHGKNLRPLGNSEECLKLQWEPVEGFRPQWECRIGRPKDSVWLEKFLDPSEKVEQTFSSRANLYKI